MYGPSGSCPRRKGDLVVAGSSLTVSLPSAEEPYALLVGNIVTAVGCCSRKDVIATQAITYLFFPNNLCLSPRRFLSSQRRERARRRLLVPLSLLCCGGTVSKSWYLDAHILYLI